MQVARVHGGAALTPYPYLATAPRPIPSTPMPLAESFVHLDIQARGTDVRLYVAAELETRIRRRQLRLGSMHVAMKDEIPRALVEENGGMLDHRTTLQHSRSPS